MKKNKYSKYFLPRSVYLSLLCLGIFSSVLAQYNMPYNLNTSPFIEYTAKSLMKNNAFDILNVENKYENIEGSPYMFDEFQIGLLYSSKVKAIFKINMNINAYSNKIEFLYEDKLLEIPNFVFDSLIVGSDKFIPTKINKKGVIELVLMEVLKNDSLGNYLLKKEIVKYFDEQAEQPFKERIPARFKRIPTDYYIYTAENKLMLLDNMRKFNKNKYYPEEVKSFIRKNKISKKDENSLKSLFSFIYL